MCFGIWTKCLSCKKTSSKKDVHQCLQVVVWNNPKVLMMTIRRDVSGSPDAMEYVLKCTFWYGYGWYWGTWQRFHVHGLGAMELRAWLECHGSQVFQPRGLLHGKISFIGRAVEVRWWPFWKDSPGFWAEVALFVVYKMLLGCFSYGKWGVQPEMHVLLASCPYRRLARDWEIQSTTMCSVCGQSWMKTEVTLGGLELASVLDIRVATHG